MQRWAVLVIEPICSVLRIAPWVAITDYVIERSVGAKPWLTIRDGVSTVRSNIGNPLTNGIPYGSSWRPRMPLASDGEASPCDPLQEWAERRNGKDVDATEPDYGGEPSFDASTGLLAAQ